MKYRVEVVVYAIAEDDPDETDADPIFEEDISPEFTNQQEAIDFASELATVGQIRR